ncbi:hypothetical protein ACICHK_38160 [Streptomyces sp. AHU1]|uniref:hypothetical protein n=1 Tax=Streptomyces sp. AHU1 TaxID=3377215 RepID=UPI00387801A9
MKGAVGQLNGVVERVVGLPPHARRLGRLPGGGDAAGALGGVVVADVLIAGCALVAASDGCGGEKAEDDE